MDKPQINFESFCIVIKNINTDTINTTRYLEIQNTIDNIYHELNIYLIEGTFREDFNYEKIKDLFNTKQSELDENNIENEEYHKIRKDLQFLLEDFKEIQYLKQFFDEKREENYVFIKPNSTDESTLTSRKVFHINLDILKLDLLILRNPYQQILSRLLLNKKILENLEQEGRNKEIINLLKEKIIYHLYRIWQINDKAIIPVQFEEEKTQVHINDEIRKTNFSGVKEDFLFLVHDNKWIYRSTEKYNTLLKESKYQRSDILIMLSILYKKTKKLESLKDLFYSYEWYIDTTPCMDKTYINYIFIWNCLLSLLVDNYKNNNLDADREIRDLFKTKLQNDKYKNYFSYFKYSEYKLIKSKKELEKNLFKCARSSINWAIKYIEKSIDSLHEDRNNEYFELDDKDNLIEINDKNINNIKQLYCYQKLGIPYRKHIKKKKLEQLKQDILRQENKILHDESIYEIDQYSENNKMNAMTILGLFTGIITYSFGTIQIFSIIENIGDAVLFSGIFLSWILFLIGAIFFKPIQPRKNKGGLLLFLGFIIFSITIILKYIYSWDILQINKTKTVNQELQSTINQAKILQQELNEKKYYKSLYSWSDKNRED